jgi:hypothetical protein
LFSKLIYLPPDHILLDYYMLERIFHEVIQEQKNENRVLVASRDVLLPKLISGEIEVEEKEADTIRRDL